MNPLFDFNGDGKMDMLEFLIGTAGDPDNPLHDANDDLPWDTENDDDDDN